MGNKRAIIFVCSNQFYDPFFYDSFVCLLAWQLTRLPRSRPTGARKSRQKKLAADHWLAQCPIVWLKSMDGLEKQMSNSKFGLQIRPFYLLDFPIRLQEAK